MRKFWLRMLWLPLMPIFGAAGEGGGEGGAGDEGAEGDEGASGGEKAGEDKKFSQKDLNSIAAKEKKQGRSAAFKDLGFESEEAAKAAVAAWKKSQEDQKTELQKEKERAEAAEKEKGTLAQQMTLANYKLEALKAGVNVEYVDDVIALAAPKVTEEQTIDKVLEEMKKGKYELFFQAKAEDKGTGGGLGGKRGKPGETGKGADLGRSLAEQKFGKAGEKPKSHYFG